MQKTINNVLVVGASGYIGKKLVPRLLDHGHKVSCLVRDGRRIAEESWYGSVKIFEGDVLDATTLAPAVKEIDVIYYLVHSMGSAGGDFAALDRQAAENAGEAAKRAGVKRIIYLGGLGQRHVGQSLHLKSRHEVGDILRSSGVPVTEFRAAVIIGAGSFSFEMIHHLTNRLPLMICPRWVLTKTQPISIDDVLSYLADALVKTESTGRTLDIGGPDVLTYRDMMLQVARTLGLRRRLIKVPVLTPRLSSYWVGLVTPVPIKPARAIIEGLRHETVCENDDARKIFDVQPEAFAHAVERALSPVTAGPPATHAAGDSIISRIEPSHILNDRRQVRVAASGERLFAAVCSLGGENGWFVANWLWQIRGLMDEMVGGVGLRRGRSHPNGLSEGDILDFWRVEEFVPGRRLLLRAEMKVPGKAWLEFTVNNHDGGRSTLVQTARFYPRGLPGILYWYGIYPIHVWVFRQLVKAIARRAERAPDSTPDKQPE